MKYPVMKFLLPALISSALLFPVVLRAQQDAPAVNVDAILRELDAMEQQQKQALRTAQLSALASLRAASQSGQASASLYMDAVEAVEYAGSFNKGASFSEWKSSNGDLFRSRDFQTIVQLHLKYLVLSLERANSDQPAAFIAPSLAYVDELLRLPIVTEPAGKPDRPGDRDKDKEKEKMAKELSNIKKSLLDKSIADGIFSKWLRLGPWLPKGDGWEMVAGNYSGILEKNIRKAMRDQKSPQLVGTWDMEMKVLADRATAGRLDYLAADFNSMVRPKMLFSRANDMVIVGMNNRAAGEIYALVKTYPQHPDFAKWVARLRELLKPSAASSDSATAAPDTSPQ